MTAYINADELLETLRLCPWLSEAEPAITVELRFSTGARISCDDNSPRALFDVIRELAKKRAQS